MRFAQVKEEPAQRAGDTEQNAWPTLLRATTTPKLRAFLVSSPYGICASSYKIDSD